jgi:hypothetical protein
MIVYDTNHLSSMIVCGALAKGFGADIISAKWPRPLEVPAMFYGRDRGTLEIMREAIARREDWFMCDNGYMGAGQYDGYYKLTRNGFQCDGLGEPDENRLAKLVDDLGLVIKPKWRAERERGHILICPPIVEYERVHWFSHTHWLRNVQRMLKSMKVKRETKIRYKPGDPRDRNGRTLSEDFKACHAIITHDSNIAVEAIIAGIPVFCTGTTPATVFGDTDIRMIDDPKRSGDRHEWLAILAANQWTLSEIREGAAIEAMKRPRIGP